MQPRMLKVSNNAKESKPQKLWRNIDRRLKRNRRREGGWMRMERWR